MYACRRRRSSSVEGLGAQNLEAVTGKHRHVTASGTGLPSSTGIPSGAGCMPTSRPAAAAALLDSALARSLPAASSRQRKLAFGIAHPDVAVEISLEASTAASGPELRSALRRRHGGRRGKVSQIHHGSPDEAGPCDARETCEPGSGGADLQREEEGSRRYAAGDGLPVAPFSATVCESPAAAAAVVPKLVFSQSPEMPWRTEGRGAAGEPPPLALSPRTARKR